MSHVKKIAVSSLTAVALAATPATPPPAARPPPHVLSTAVFITSYHCVHYFLALCLLLRTEVCQAVFIAF